MARDVATQLQVMETLGRLQQETRCCLILIGHDMGLMAQFVDRLAVMYAGRVVEVGNIEEMFAHPRHPYTRMLIESCRATPIVAASSASREPRAVAAPIAARLRVRASLPAGDAALPDRATPVEIAGGRPCPGMSS